MMKTSAVAAFVLVLVWSCPNAYAADPTPTFQGKFEQGGLIVGRTDPKATVELDGRKIPVGADGRFLLGFAYDAPAKETLTVALHGKRDSVPLAIAQRTYQTQAISGLPKEEVTPSAKDMVRIRKEEAMIVAARHRKTGTKLFHSRFIWPVEGIITGVYGSRRILNGQPRSPHLGVDIAAPAGTPIVAPTEGTVVLAAPDLFFTGNTVMIDHGQGLTTVYVHLKRMEVKVGEHVAQGQVIGTLGQTGRATGPNLHWGMHLDGVGLDPELVVGPMPAPAFRAESKNGGSGPAAP